MKVNAIVTNYSIRNRRNEISARSVLNCSCRVTNNEAIVQEINRTMKLTHRIKVKLFLGVSWIESRSIVVHWVDYCILLLFYIWIYCIGVPWRRSRIIWRWFLQIWLASSVVFSVILRRSGNNESKIFYSRFSLVLCNVIILFTNCCPGRIVT